VAERIDHIFEGARNLLELRVNLSKFREILKNSNNN
jgi:hypothetical protein